MCTTDVFFSGPAPAAVTRTKILQQMLTKRIYAINLTGDKILRYVIKPFGVLQYWKRAALLQPLSRRLLLKTSSLKRSLKPYVNYRCRYKSITRLYTRYELCGRHNKIRKCVRRMKNTVSAVNTGNILFFPVTFRGFHAGHTFLILCCANGTSTILKSSTIIFHKKRDSDFRLFDSRSITRLGFRSLRFHTVLLTVLTVQPLPAGRFELLRSLYKKYLIKNGKRNEVVYTIYSYMYTYISNQQKFTLSP